MNIWMVLTLHAELGDAGRKTGCWLEGLEGLEEFAAPYYIFNDAGRVQRRVRWADGKPAVRGRQVTGFASSEERASGLTEALPFLVEDTPVALGGLYTRAPDWQAHVVVDRGGATGLNPASAALAAQALLKLLDAA